jgi:hypothetical protein
MLSLAAHFGEDFFGFVAGESTVAAVCWQLFIDLVTSPSPFLPSQAAKPRNDAMLHRRTPNNSTPNHLAMRYVSFLDYIELFVF